jgi:hypothetical protein
MPINSAPLADTSETRTSPRRVEVLGQIGRNRPKREKRAQEGGGCSGGGRPFDDDPSI